MASPEMFKRALIEEQSIKTGYIGGSLGSNNTARTLEQAEAVLPVRPFATLLSLGSGQLHLASVPERGRLSQFLPSKLVATLNSIATDCEKTNQELLRRFKDIPNVYFRFNAEQGMQGIDQYDVARLSEVRTHTRNYLQDAAITSKIDSAAKVIAKRVGAVKITRASQEERWLLIFNNADDPKLNLKPFFPSCTRRDVIITTRNQQMRDHTRGPISYCRVSEMLPDDTAELLLKVSGAEEMDTFLIASTLVKVWITNHCTFKRALRTLSQRLSFLALAVVQSGAYMRTTEC